MAPPGMVPPVMVPAEETVEALIEFLVSPFLPRRSMSCYHPTLQQQEIVANQMYAVVLLYNYYHRKQFPTLEFLDFCSFCKVACICKPSLLGFLNAISKSDMSSGDLDEPLSMTEKMIMDGCNVSSALDASKSAPDMEGWPISKVAVFLVDQSKQHCLLRSNGSAQAIIKSLFEKNIEMSLVEDKFNGLEDILQEVAFSTVKEQMGISHSNLSILGCHLSYSLNHLKSCTRLYIMSYAEPIDNQIPIKAVIRSLQAPLVKINSGAFEVTEVIEYYSLLPYVDILSDWLSGNSFGSASHHNLSQKIDAVKKGYQGVNFTNIYEVSGDFGWSNGNTNNNCSSKAAINNKIISENENYHSPEVFSVRSQNAVASSSTKNAVLSTVKEAANKDDFPALTEQNWDSSKKRKVESVLAGSSVAVQHYNVHDSSTNNQFNSNNHELVPSKKVDIMSALQMLKKKRDELCHQQRLLEDNVAHCEMSIQTVLSGKDSSESKVDFMLKTCELLGSNEMQNDANLSTKAQCLPQTIGTKKLCDAVLRLQSPCQELDEIFCTNNWILPKYCVLPSSDGNFQALVMARGMDFECDSFGECKSSPIRARESAATHMLSKLRSMAASLPN